MYVCGYGGLSLNIYIHIHTYIHAYTHTYIYIYTCILRKEFSHLWLFYGSLQKSPIQRSNVLLCETLQFTAVWGSFD